MTQATRHPNAKTFPYGGVHPADRKLSAAQALTRLPVPKTVQVPLSQHIGAPAKPVVQPGDEVRTGQLIAEAAGFISANIHAPVTGKVRKIEPVFDASGYKRPAIWIDVAESETWIEGVDLGTDLKTTIDLSPEEIVNRIHAGGIVGMGGATFPSYVKLKVPQGKTAEYLIINGAECEPFLTADHRLMLEKGAKILVGVQILLKALGITTAIIGIEDNKPDAIRHLRDLARDTAGITVQALKTQYPQGGERQLIKSLVNREIPPPPKGLPIDVGCVVFNVATVFAVYEAVQKNKPLIERVVTVTGPSLAEPKNVWARIGTSVTQLIAAAGGLPGDTAKVISGGPMMGKALKTMDIPVIKGTSGILVVPDAEAHRKKIANCIRCAKCVSACPLGLEPYLLMTLTERQLFDRAEQERILNCCECACCAFICPANRPLLDYIRLGKSVVTKNLKAREKK